MDYYYVLLYYDNLWYDNMISMVDNLWENMNY